jgi:hypothetical protein
MIAFRSHWGFASEYCRPARGNEKGGVEMELGWFRRNWLVPVPVRWLSDDAFVVLLKWSDEKQRFLLYPSEIADDERFFNVGDIKIKPTPQASTYFDQLSFTLGEQKPEASKPRIGFVR